MTQQDDMRGFSAPRNVVRGPSFTMPTIPPKVLKAFPEMAQWREQWNLDFAKFWKENLVAISDRTG